MVLVWNVVLKLAYFKNTSNFEGNSKELPLVEPVTVQKCIRAENK